jgi:c-di-AMP phosphodiesterase-like protein
MLTRKEKRAELGRIGEQTFKNLCEAKGYEVKISVDKYDSKKDMTVNGKTVEIKTQTPWFLKRWVTFNETQEKKMRSVDFLFVVGYNNCNQEKFDWANKIWRIKKDFKIVKKYVNSRNKKMFAISLDDPAVSVWNDTPENVVTVLKKYSSSEFI